MRLIFKMAVLLLLSCGLAGPALAQSAIYNPNLPVLTVPGDSTPLRVDANGNLKVTSTATGDVASGATDSGSPVKIGCIAATAINATTAGQRSNVLCNGGALATFQTTVPYANAPADAAAAQVGFLSNPTNFGVALTLGVSSQLWNGTSLIGARGDSNGQYVVGSPSAAAAVGITPVPTPAVASSVVAKASAGNLYGLNVTAGASAGFIMVFNATTAPADGAVTPVRCIPLAANTGIELAWRSVPMVFSTGITVVFSTTGCFSKTASATAFISADAK